MSDARIEGVGGARLPTDPRPGEHDRHEHHHDPHDALQAAALSYADRGWLVFPAHSIAADGGCTCGDSKCKHPAKHPRTKNGLLDATRDKHQILAWWGKWPDANVAIRTGPESGLVVLDVDPRNGGEDGLEDLIATHGALPETVASLTGGGGSQHFFKYPGGDRKIKSLSGLRGFAGVDVKGSGGYVIAPPSRHLSGRTYEWNVLLHPDDVPLAPLPESISKLATEKRDEPRTSVHGEDEKVREGDRHAFLCRIAGTLRARGLSAEALEASLLEINRTMCDPPRDEADVRRIARDIGTKPAGEQTYPGANGTEPPDAETLRAERLRKLLRGVTGRIAFAEDGSVIPPPIRRYVIESVIPAKKNGLLVGFGGVGKGLTEIALAHRMILQEPIQGVRILKPGVAKSVQLDVGAAGRGVLIICREDDYDEIHRRLIAFNILRYGEKWEERISPEESELIHRFLHIVYLPGTVALDGLLVRELAARANEVPELAWVVIDPLGRLQIRDAGSGRTLPFTSGEYAGQVTDALTDLVEARRKPPSRWQCT